MRHQSSRAKSRTRQKSEAPAASAKQKTARQRAGGALLNKAGSARASEQQFESQNFDQAPSRPRKAKKR